MFISVKRKPKASFFAVSLELYQLFYKEPVLWKNLSKMYRRTNDPTAVDCAKLRLHLEDKDYRNVKVMLLVFFNEKNLQFTDYICINVSTEYFVKLIDNYYAT